MIKHYKFKECWLINWTNTRENKTNMWKRTFEKFKNYTWMKKQEEVKKGLKMKK